MILFSAVIEGPPRTKGNSPMLLKGSKFPRMLPGKNFRAWEKIALQQLWILTTRCSFVTIDEPVNVTAVFYRDRMAGDLDNYFKALGDVLQKAKILKNDRQIVSWNGSRLDKDSKRPRVVLEIVGSQS